MFKKLSLFSLALVLGLFFVAGSAYAGAKIKIGDDSQFDLGMRVQAQWATTDEDLDTDGKWDSEDDFNIRRARLRLKADVTKWVTAFLQSDSADGVDHKIIDAWISLNIDPWFKLIMGENMAPTMRTNITSSGGLMTMDRPGLANKNLTWGMNNKYRFNSRTVTGNRATNVGSATNAVRDTGITAFGSGSLSETMHLKYYLGYADGMENGPFADEDEERLTARVQLNMGDPEPGYFGLGTYLGKKQTMAIGVFYDTEDNVGQDPVTPTKGADYSQWGIDLFAEQPVGPGHVTFDAQFVDLDLDDSNRQIEGDGFYVQAGYLINNWQPWVMYEQWDAAWSSKDSVVAPDVGDNDTFRIGLTYFFKGHNANVKVGYEKVSFDEDIITVGTNSEDSISTFMIGWYMTY
ncbi:MAG: porin [bacterium]|nr:porin [bacterium]